MPQINLLRNTKVFLTTLTELSISPSAITPANTFEIQVQADFKYSQGTEQQTITLNEAGATPSRGQRSFNTKINPVDWNFASYVRPYAVTEVTGNLSAVGPGNGTEATVTTSAAHNLSLGDRVTLAGATGYNGTYYIIAVPSSTTFKVSTSSTAADPAAGTFTRAARTTAPEAILWNALAGSQQLYASNTWTETATEADLVFTNSNAHQLAPFGLIFKTDNSIYFVPQCAVNQADISFSIDAIASIAWTGQGTKLIRLTDAGYPAALTTIVSANTWDTVAGFITNKLSTVTLTGYNINNGVTTIATQAYSLALTGGQLTVNNNIQYLTPEVLGAVNQAIGYYTGTRSISGNFTAYLKVKAGADTDKYASELLEDLVAHSAESPDNVFNMVLSLGGAGSSFPKVDFAMPATMLQIPAIDVADVVATTINFTGQGSTGTGAATAYDINAANELTVTYVTA